jgi:NAD(P)-dependent dehydrogenase (short-subunit alcohol dehydrogenase family)
MNLLFGVRCATKNKKAIVIGGSQGIGKGIAISLTEAGADVLIQYHSAKDKALSHS